MKTLLSMIEQVCFPVSPSQQNNDINHSTVIRLKFINNVLSDQKLFEICKKNMSNFEFKVVSFLIYAYLNNASVNDDNDSVSSISNKKSNNATNLIDIELNNFLANSSEKILIFNELNLRNDATLENFIIDFIQKYAVRLKQTESFATKKIELENFTVYFQDFLKLINSLASISSHAVIYKCYLLASQIVLSLSVHLHGRGRSDTIFAKIIDKMILPYGSIKSNNKPPSANNLIQSNNQNSILISLKDTLYLFLTGISKLNYEYDGYLQRVLQSIVANFSMKFQMLQFDDHFITLALESSFHATPNEEIIRFRTFLFKSMKQAFFIDLKPNPDLDKYLSLMNHFLMKTESNKVINEDAKINFGSILLLLGNESNALKTKALALFNAYLKITKKSLNETEEEEDQEFNSVYIKAIENLLKTFWHQVEPNKIFISLSSIARQNKSLITSNIKYLILQKVEETPSKFRFNAELKNTLFTLFELIDGDQGKVYLNTHLGHILHT